MLRLLTEEVTVDGDVVVVADGNIDGDVVVVDVDVDNNTILDRCSAIRYL